MGKIQGFLMLMQVVHTVTTLSLLNMKLKFMGLEEQLLCLEYLLNNRHLKNAIFVFILLFVNYKLKVQQLHRNYILRLLGWYN